MKSSGLAFVITLALALAFGLSVSVNAAAATKRAKVIDFDDEVVEGLNKKPLDSLSEISERDKRHKKPHLYLKRVGFRPEVSEALKILPHSQ
jgi:hypothetical protein